MPGYEFWPQVRITPADGDALTIDLRDGLQDAPRPISVALEYGLEIEKRYDVNKALRPRRQGCRPVVTVTLLTARDMIDTDLVAQILNAALDRTVTVEVSVDGGVVWRTAVLTKFTGPTVAGGKSYVGATWTLQFTCVDVIWDVAALAQGAW